MEIIVWPLHFLKMALLYGLNNTINVSSDFLFKFPHSDFTTSTGISASLVDSIYAAALPVF